MPIICMFYGIIIKMYSNDHNPPHFHAEYQGHRAVFDLDGNIMKGNLPDQQTRIVCAWCTIHRDELIADWEIAHSQEGAIFKIDPLR